MVRGIVNHLFDDGGALWGSGGLAGGEETVAASINDGLQSIEWGLTGFVEGAMECHLHGSGELNNAARETDIDTPVGGEETDDHGVDTQFAT